MIRKLSTPQAETAAKAPKAPKPPKVPKAKKPKLSKAERIEARKARKAEGQGFWARFRRKPKAAPQIMPPYRDRKPSRRRDIILLTCFSLFFLIYGYAYALFTPYMIPALSLPLLLVLGLVIWQLPEMAQAPTRWLTELFFAFAFALITWPTYLAIALPGLPWITVIRLIGFPMTALFLVCLSVSSDFRHQIGKVLAVSPVMARMMILFIIAQLIALPASKHPAEVVQKVLNNSVNWTAIFYISCYVGLKPGAIRRWANIMCLVTIPICLIGLWEGHKHEVLWAGHVPPIFAVEDETVARILGGASREGGDHRVQSVFTTPLGLAEYLALTLPFILHFAIKPGNLALRFLALLWAGLMYWVVLLTDARLGVIGCLMTMLLYAFAWGALQWRRRKDSIFAPALVLSYPALAMAAFAATFAIGRLREKIWGSGQYDASTEGRKQMYNEGIPMILSHPWGYGAGMGASALGITNPSGVLTIDTYYIALGLDYGILGFIGYYVMIGWATYKTGRWALEIKQFDGEYSYFMPLAISLLNFFYIKAVFSNEENHPIVFMMMGLGLALGYRLLQEKKPVTVETERDQTRVSSRLGGLFGGRQATAPKHAAAPTYPNRQTPTNSR